MQYNRFYPVRFQLSTSAWGPGFDKKKLSAFMTPQILSVGLEDLIRSPPTGSLPLNTDAQGGIGFALLPNNHLNGVGIVAENFFIGSSLEVSAKSRDVICQLWFVRMQLYLPRFFGPDFNITTGKE